MIYGLTVISSDGDIIAKDINGVEGYRESITKLFASKDAAIRYAVMVAEEYFNLNDEFSDAVEKDREPSDENGYTLKQIKEELARGEDAVIQYASFHIEFDLFAEEVSE